MLISWCPGVSISRFAACRHLHPPVCPSGGESLLIDGLLRLVDVHDDDRDVVELPRRGASLHAARLLGRGDSAAEVEEVGSARFLGF